MAVAIRIQTGQEGNLTEMENYAEKFKGDAVLTFGDVPLAIKAEKALKQAGWPTRLVAPPAEAGLGCALGVEILLAQHDDIKRLLVSKNMAYTRLFKLTQT
jgi:hypothetical protein